MTTPLAPPPKKVNDRFDDWMFRFYKQSTATPAGSVAWGSITGTLSNQTDLQNALNAAAAGALLRPFMLMGG